MLGTQKDLFSSSSALEYPIPVRSLTMTMPEERRLVGIALIT